MKKAANEERRRRRSASMGEALRLQLDACREAGALKAMVLSDEMGLCVAKSGAGPQEEELAARLPQTVGADVSKPPAALPTGLAVGVALRRFSVGKSTLFLCAVGGKAEARNATLEHAERGFRRILAAS